MSTIASLYRSTMSLAETVVTRSDKTIGKAFDATDGVLDTVVTATTSVDKLAKAATLAGERKLTAMWS